MFHVKGSGTQTQPIVIGSFGDLTLPVPTIDGNGFQTALLVYNDSFIEVDGLNFTNQASHLDENGQVKKISTFLGESNDWGSGKNVRFGIKVVADSTSVQGIVITDVQIHDIYPTPSNSDYTHLGYGIKFENRSDTLIGLINTINDVSISDVHITKTGHTAFGSKPLGWLATTSSKTKTSIFLIAPSPIRVDRALSPTGLAMSLWNIVCSTIPAQASTTACENEGAARGRSNVNVFSSAQP